MDIESELGYDDENEALDPRIKEELDNLNTCSDTINKLGNELQTAREKFEMNKRKAKNTMSKLYKSVGRRNVQLSKRYYGLFQDIEKIKNNLHKSTINYQNLQTHYDLSRKKVEELEKKLSQQANKLDVVLLDKLNNANNQLIKIKNEMMKEEDDHSRMTGKLFTLEKQLAEEFEQHSNHITATGPFFQLKRELEKKLRAERQNAEDLHLALVCQQQKYKMALVSLENISNEEHMRRKMMSTVMMGIRTPGVGAEKDGAGYDDDDELNMSSHLSTDDDNMDIMDDDSAFSDYDLQKTIANLILDQQRLQSDSTITSATINNPASLNQKSSSTTSLNVSTSPKTTMSPPSTTTTTKTPTTTTTTPTKSRSFSLNINPISMVRGAIDGAESQLPNEGTSFHSNDNNKSNNNNNTDLNNKFALIQLSNNSSSNSNKAKHFSISTNDSTMLKSQMWSNALSSTAALQSGVYTASNKKQSSQQQLTLLSPMMLQGSVPSNNNRNNDHKRHSLSTSTTSLSNTYF